MLKFIFLSFVIVLIGCQQHPQETIYTEITTDTGVKAVQSSDPHAGMDMSAMTKPTADMAINTDVPFKWQVPDGWQEEPGKGFRMASFYLTANKEAIDASIVSLSGAAGGLEANLRRWMGQIGIEASDEDLGVLIKAAPALKIKAGGEGKIFDFSILQSALPDTTKSMIAVMIGMDQSTVFVKITGSIADLKVNKDKFLQLAQSIESKNAAESALSPAVSVDPHAGMDMSANGVAMATSNFILNNAFTWQLPKGWKEGALSPMRLATFKLAKDENALDCSIVSLSANAGGVTPNLERWLVQLGMDPSQENVDKLINNAQEVKAKGGWQISVYDFGVLQKKSASSDKSMITATMSQSNDTVFIKMTGSVGVLKENKGNYLKLLESIDLK